MQARLTFLSSRSVTYRVAIAQVPVSGEWQLRAEFPRGYGLCAYANSEEAMRKAVYEEGMEWERATVARTILERLIEEGRAEGGVRRLMLGVRRPGPCWSSSALGWLGLIGFAINRSLDAEHVAVRGDGPGSF